MNIFLGLLCLSIVGGMLELFMVESDNLINVAINFVVGAIRAILLLALIALGGYGVHLILS